MTANEIREDIEKWLWNYIQHNAERFKPYLDDYAKQLCKEQREKEKKLLQLIKDGCETTLALPLELTKAGQIALTNIYNLCKKELNSPEPEI